MSNSTNAGIFYPKSGHLYLLNEIQKAHENIMCLINLCVEKDQKIAELENLMATTDPEKVVNLKS